MKTKHKTLRVPAIEFQTAGDVHVHLLECGFTHPVVVRDRRRFGVVLGFSPNLRYSVKLARPGAIGFGHDRNGTLVVTCEDEEYKQQVTMLYYLLRGTNTLVGI